MIINQWQNWEMILISKVYFYAAGTIYALYISHLAYLMCMSLKNSPFKPMSMSDQIQAIEGTNFLR